MHRNFHQVRCSDYKRGAGGKRSKTSGLLQINNQQQPEANNFKEHEAYGIINSRTTKQRLAQYHHACAFSPAISTWTKAIKKGHFATWPGLTEEVVQKYYTPDDEISLGYMKAKKRSSNRTPQRTVSDPDPYLPDLEPKFDFLRTPLAPPGTRAIIYVPTPNRRTFEFNGKTGWYVGPTLRKYKHCTFYIPSTFREQEANTMDWKPKKIVFF